jgi:hypothetical protein
VKKPISKAHIRTEINDQIANFLKKGGHIAEIERGTSGRELADGPLKNSISAFQQPRAERTYVPEVIAALEERRKPKVTTKEKKVRKPKKEIIYDDFGEPLRWQWKED